MIREIIAIKPTAVISRMMRRFEVSNRVNLVKYDDPACAELVARLGAAATP